MYKFFILSLVLFTTVIAKADNGISVKLSKQITSENISSLQFPGGENAFSGYLKNNIRYPKLLVEIEMEGEVDVKFTVTKEGDIANVEILRGFDPLADDEVIRVIKSMPRWIPATANVSNTDFEEKVTVSFTITDSLLARINNPDDDNEKETDTIEEPKLMDMPANEPETVVIDTLMNKAPEFPGGIKAMDEYFAANMKYPKQAIKYKIEGRVVFNLTISPTGEITRIALIKSLIPDCDEEAFFLIKKMPKWIPGLKDREPATMSVIVPVSFKLPE